MTREQAIEILKEWRDIKSCPIIPQSWALDKMVSALEQEPCADAVSREAVYHILDEVGGDFDKPREAVVPLDYIVDMIAELPSVTPKPETGRWIMTDDVDVYYNLPSYKCSKCGQTSLENGDYCPSCGSYNGGESSNANCN